MADTKDGGGFLRKMVRFVANPATDWNDIGARPDEHQDLERAELKAMIERKRRNDFVRKREFETLRRLRRDGLSPEQLAALGGASRGDDSEARLTDTVTGVRAELGVKAKIDEIEQQMVGEGATRPAGAPSRQPVPTVRREPIPTRPSDFYNQPTEPAPLSYSTPLPPLDNPPSLAGLDHPLGPAPPRPRPPTLTSTVDATRPTAAAASAKGAGGPQGEPRTAAPTPGAPGALAASAAPAAPAATSRVMPLTGAYTTGSQYEVEVNEVVHDPDLDEAVISFANADFTHCEQALTALCRPGGARHEHADTWLVLFDLYRATGQQMKFDALALEYATHFHSSSPQWFSMPRMVADAAAEERPDTRGMAGEVGWVCPVVLDTEAVARLRSTTLQLPLPWVLDWSGVERVDAEAATQLQVLFRQWAPQALDMRWLAADRLLMAMQEAAPTGVRDGDPAFWMARLEALRLANRPDQFDETAIDYCVTYEVSPPSWERARCTVRLSGGGSSTSAPPMSIISEVSTSFLESGLHDDGRATQMATVELSGQLSGDIGRSLAQLDRQLGNANLVQVSCARLIRVDFIAAGDLLNWVLAKQNENRSVTFVDAHRMVALFFGAMGINEHARVQVTRQ
jgi:ABC-type transporter Mla MlaB component